MTDERDSEGRKKVREAIELREQRRKHWQTEGERSIWKNLQMIGALGWLIVVPTLLGVLVGRWLDHKFESGVFFSGACIFLGVCAGAYLAWKRIDSS